MTTTLSMQVNHPSQAALGDSEFTMDGTPENRTVTWERLEALRLQRLGLSNKYSRHFNVLRSQRPKSSHGLALTFGADRISTQGIVFPQQLRKTTTSLPGSAKNNSNSIAPFSTVGKPTCGFFFSRETDNKKKKFGIPPSDLVKWRNFAAQNVTQ